MLFHHVFLAVGHGLRSGTIVTRCVSCLTKSAFREGMDACDILTRLRILFAIIGGFVMDDNLNQNSEIKCF